MWGAIIGAALSVASSVAGGISNAKARKAQKKLLEQRKRDNQSWYERKYNEDPLKRASTQRMLTQMNEQIRDRNKAAKGRQAVMGGTEDSVAAAKEANNKVMADTTSQIVAQNDSRKDAIEQQYLNRKNSLDDAEANIQEQQAGQTAQTISSVAGTAANITNALDNAGSKATASSGSVASQTNNAPLTDAPKVGDNGVDVDNAKWQSQRYSTTDTDQPILA